MDLFVEVSLKIGVLSGVIEAICETIFRVLDNVGLKGLMPAWKPVIVILLTTVGCVGLGIDALAQAGVYFQYPWVGALFTGFLVGGGADLYHLIKNKAEPKVHV